MRNLFFKSGAAIFLLLATTLLSFGQSSQKIVRVDIKHIGPIAVSDEYIRANIRIRSGDPFIGINVDDDVRNLYATGLFMNIRVSADPGEGGIVLTYILQANPRLTDIRFVGNDKVKTSSLQKRITSKIGEPLIERKIFTDKQELDKFYQKMGYPSTEIKYSLNVDENAGRATVTFEIKESAKVRISEVDFIGAHAFSQKTLRKQIKTKKYHWILAITGKGYYKSDQFDDDKDAITKYYRDHGYIDFEIQDVKFDYPDPKHMIIKLMISEGSQYKVGAVTFTGASLLSTNIFDRDRHGKIAHPGPIVDRMPLRPGNTFVASGVSSNMTFIEKFYEARGYIDVSSGSTLNVTKIPNTESNTIDLDYKVDEGEKSYVEKIEIRGNTKTKDKVLRRELAISPGEVFDMTRVDLSKRRLEGLQYFEKVDTRTEPTDVPDRKNLVIGVEEKNTGNFSVGAGFSSVDALVGFVEVGQGNFDLFNPPRFTGAGQKMRLRIQLGTQREDFTLSFTEPWFLGKKLALGIEIFHHEYGFQSLQSLYTEDHTGIEFSLSRALPTPRLLEKILGPGDLVGSVHYSLDQIGILLNFQTNSVPIPPKVNTNAPQDILAQNGFSLMTKVGGSLSYDTRNSTRLPDHGQKTELSGELASTYLGGDHSFYKVEVKSAWYFKGFSEGSVLELNGSAGIADGLDGQDVPFYERFYLGGLDSLRGYQYRGISPRQRMVPGDPTSGFLKEPVGGDTYWFGSAEYSIPIIDRLRLAWFYDIGEVQASPYKFDAANYDDDVGIGLRMNLPIGPLRIDYGIPVTHDKFNSGSGRFQFGVGYTRQF